MFRTFLWKIFNLLNRQGFFGLMNSALVGSFGRRQQVSCLSHRPPLTFYPSSFPFIIHSFFLNAAPPPPPPPLFSLFCTPPSFPSLLPCGQINHPQSGKSCSDSSTIQTTSARERHREKQRGRGGGGGLGSK